MSKITVKDILYLKEGVEIEKEIGMGGPVLQRERQAQGWLGMLTPEETGCSEAFLLGIRRDLEGVPPQALLVVTEFAAGDLGPGDFPRLSRECADALEALKRN